MDRDLLIMVRVRISVSTPALRWYGRCVVEGYTSLSAR